MTDFELLRNFILRYSNLDEKENVKKKLKKLEELLGKDIETFLKHYVLHKYGKKTDKNENRPYKVISAEEKLKGVTIALDDLLCKAAYYNKMTNYEDCTALEKKIFSFFKRRRQQQFRPLVMGLMHQKDLNALSQEEYDKYLEFLYEFFICYHLIGEQTSNKIEDIVYGYSQRIENEFDVNMLKRFRKSMAERIPNEENFCNSIKRVRYSSYWKAYSDARKAENVRAIFEIVERELGYEGSFDNMNIEHCMPDSIAEENAHIGNLMLIEKTLNDQCKNKPIDEKIQYYQNSALKYPKLICSAFGDGEKSKFEYRSNEIAKILYSRIKNVRKLDATTV